MAKKRRILELFTRSELLSAVDRFGLVASDRRSTDALIDVLARSAWKASLGNTKERS